jgi:arylsulfatase
VPCRRRSRGASMAYTFKDSFAAERHTTQYFEVYGNHGI